MYSHPAVRREGGREEEEEKERGGNHKLQSIALPPHTAGGPTLTLVVHCSAHVHLPLPLPQPAIWALEAISGQLHLLLSIVLLHRLIALEAKDGRNNGGMIQNNGGMNKIERKSTCTCICDV